MKNSKSSISRDIYDIMETVSVSLIVIFVVLTMIFRICVVDGSSMEDTLQNSEKLLVTDSFGDPERGDIIVFQETSRYNKPLVKRVIATGGEWIKLEDGEDKLLITVYDENQENPIDITEEFGTYKSFYRSLEALMPANDSLENGVYYAQVPENCVFVLGDNRNNSADSRYFGFVDNRTIIGKLVLRVFPLSSFGTVD